MTKETAHEEASRKAAHASAAKPQPQTAAQQQHSRAQEETSRKDAVENTKRDAAANKQAAQSQIATAGPNNEPVTGAAGYEKPELNPAPGSPEYAVAHPGFVTSGGLEQHQNAEKANKKA